MAAISTYTTSEHLSEGLQGCNTCDHALQTARRTAAQRNEPVVLDDDDGTWIVEPDGNCRRPTEQESHDR